MNNFKKIFVCLLFAILLVGVVSASPTFAYMHERELFIIRILSSTEIAIDIHESKDIHLTLIESDKNMKIFHSFSKYNYYIAFVKEKSYILVNDTRYDFVGSTNNTTYPDFWE